MKDSHPHPSRSFISISLLAGILAVSTAAIFIRFAQSEGVPSIVIATARMTISTLILAPIALIRYRTHFCLLSRQEWILAMLSGIFLALHFATWITSLEYTSVASSVVLVTTTPLWVALFAPLVLKEKVGLATLLGLALALAGGFIVGVSDACIWQIGSVTCPQLRTLIGGRAILGDFLALFGAWMAAGYMLVGRKLRARMELVPYIFLVFGMAAVALIFIMVGMQESLLGFPPSAYFWFILLALVPQLFGHSIFNWALKFLPASFVSITLLGEPVGSTVLAYFIFQEAPGWVKIIGAILILLGIWLAARGEN